MLSQLYIENLAVIKNADINFKSGFNIFTGETGAGKTIFVTAISGILGGKLSKDIVRTGEKKAVIMAVFDSLPQNAIDIASDMGYDIKEQLLVLREINNEGKSICKINGKPATLAVLKEIIQPVVDIHGQQDNNTLVSSEKQVELIDTYGDTKDALAEYRGYYERLLKIEEDITALMTSESEKAQRTDILAYQIEEIEEAELVDGEEEELLAEQKIMQNSEKIMSDLSQADEILNGEYALGESIGTLMNLLENLKEYIPSTSHAANQCTEFYYEVQEIAATVRENIENFEFSTMERDRIENRLDTIYKLKRKYGQSIVEILSFLDSASAELESINSSEERLLKLHNEKVKIKLAIRKSAEALTKKRKKAIKDFTAALEGELAFLDMPSVKMLIQIEEREYSNFGADKITFMISVNPGEPPKPIAKIASGGEIARIMLAIKNVLADKDSISTMIFDEVDSGVSGKAAAKIGKKLKQCAKDKQVICVTHLAQVAAYGESHFKIEKSVENNKTFTQVNELIGDMRVSEIARIMVGDNPTQTAMDSARELLIASS